MLRIMLLEDTRKRSSALFKLLSQAFNAMLLEEYSLVDLVFLIHSNPESFKLSISIIDSVK